MGIRITAGNAIANNKDEFRDQLKQQINPIPESGKSLPGSMGVISLKNGGKAVKPKTTVSVKKTASVPPKKAAAAKTAVKSALAKDMAADKKMAGALGMKGPAVPTGAGRSTPGTTGLPFKNGGKVRK